MRHWESMLVARNLNKTWSKTIQIVMEITIQNMLQHNIVKLHCNGNYNVTHKNCHSRIHTGNYVVL